MHLHSTDADCMNDKAYPKWVGVVLGFLLQGSAHFLSGDKLAGLRWCVSIALASTAATLLLAMPGVAGLATAIAFMGLSTVLWLIMLKNSYRPVPRIKMRGWIAVIALGFFLSTAWQYGIGMLVQPFKIPSGAMMPTLMPGDRVVAERVTYRFKKPKRGDIVVFSTEGMNNPAIKTNTHYLKRIAGLPGEKIQIKPPYLLANGNIITDPPIFAAIASGIDGFTLAHAASDLSSVLATTEDKVLLGQNQYLVLGDNTASSLDGRYYGPIFEKQIFGRITRVYWPISRINKQTGALSGEN